MGQRSVNFDGNGLLNLQVNGAAVDALVQNGGLLKADGGQILMTNSGKYAHYGPGITGFGVH
nr:hypothetical protein [Pseudomonas chlororaphis]